MKHISLAAVLLAGSALAAAPASAQLMGAIGGLTGSMGGMGGGIIGPGAGGMGGIGGVSGLGSLGGGGAIPQGVPMYDVTAVPAGAFPTLPSTGNAGYDFVAGMGYGIVKNVGTNPSSAVGVAGFAAGQGAYIGTGVAQTTTQQLSSPGGPQAVAGEIASNSPTSEVTAIAGAAGAPTGAGPSAGGGTPSLPSAPSLPSTGGGGTPSLPTLPSGGGGGTPGLPSSASVHASVVADSSGATASISTPAGSQSVTVPPSGGGGAPGLPSLPGLPSTGGSGGGGSSGGSSGGDRATGDTGTGGRNIR